MILNMQNTLDHYRHHFRLSDALFVPITHAYGNVAIVYTVQRKQGTPHILKICSNVKDYRNECYFLKHFAHTLPVPQLIDVHEPTPEAHGALLMSYIPGQLLRSTTLTDTIAYHLGQLLAHIHASPLNEDLSSDALKHTPHQFFKEKIYEGLEECSLQFPPTFMDQCHHFYASQQHILNALAESCITHRDFGPRNILVQNNAVRGIVDWSSASATFAAEDFCFLEHHEYPIKSHHKKAFLSGYASIRPVPDYQKIMPLLLFSKALAIIGFSIKRDLWKTTMASDYQASYTVLDKLIKKRI